jgi:hypothetical protein
VSGGAGEWAVGRLRAYPALALDALAALVDGAPQSVTVRYAQNHNRGAYEEPSLSGSGAHCQRPRGTVCWGRLPRAVARSRVILSRVVLRSTQLPPPPDRTIFSRHCRLLALPSACGLLVGALGSIGLEAPAMEAGLRVARGLLDAGAEEAQRALGEHGAAQTVGVNIKWRGDCIGGLSGFHTAIGTLHLPDWPSLEFTSRVVEGSA